MKIALIDVDGHGFPNLALMKLARWHREHGDHVEWYSVFADHYDVVYMSKVFSHTKDFEYYINNADKVIKGGSGYSIDSQLEPEIDKTQPDYSIYPKIPKNMAYGFLTRGCINKCKWCIVPIKEGMIRPYMDIDEIAIEGRHKIVLMDNNILSCDYGLKQVEKIIERGYTIDFNQAMDARLVTEEIAAMLAKVKWINGTLRFGCDTHAQIKPCEDAIRRLRKYGFNDTVDLYTMLHGDIRECYERCSKWKDPEWGGKVVINAQPMLDLTAKVQHIPLWQRDMARWAGRKIIYLSTDFMDYEARIGFKGSKHFE